MYIINPVTNKTKQRRQKMIVFMTHPETLTIERLNNEACSLVFRKQGEDLHVTYQTLDQLKECASQLDDFIKEQG